MATVTITAANVIPAAGLHSDESVIVGEAVSAGDILDLKASDSKYWKAVNTTLEPSGNGNGKNNLRMALASGSANQKVSVLKPASQVAIGSVVTEGRHYVLSSTAGKMCNEADLTSTQFSTYIGYAINGTTFFFNPYSTGVDL